MIGCISRKVGFKGSKEFAQRELKDTSQCIGNWIQWARKIVVSWNVVMETLMNTKEMQQMGRDLFSGGAAFCCQKRVLRLSVLLRTVR